MQYLQISCNVARKFSGLQRQSPLLSTASPRIFPRRGFALLAVRIVRGLLKVRYLLLGGTALGGIAGANAFKEVMLLLLINIT